jgi:hypothetical protein
MIQMIRDLGGENHTQNINKSDGTRTTIRCWSVPSYEEDTPTLPVKEMNNDIPF